MNCEHDHFEDLLECARVGSQVKDFTVEVFDPVEGAFGEVTLSDIQSRGKWTVLVFYPADFTFVCPTELADLAEKHEALEKLGAEVLSVSTDTKFVHMAWKTSERLLEKVRFKMASDPAGELSRYFDVWDPDSGLALRGTFLIDPDGLLVSSEVNFYNVGRNADELLRKLAANVHVREHPEQACPARWTPGQKTLLPGEELVGKVYESLND
ncbi:peroxiredoxin [Paucidesulfovibrio longus]|uniref:peroxiredoxin n=1 Tax=Paucidesulfovibrio longus TaxID=889 RepID=UPI0003B74A39|nr:redoxin domain-containing protein [Paucidesulfovibrio longus]